MVSLFPVFFPVLAGLAMLDLKISRFKDREKYYGIHHSWFCTASNDKHRIKIPLNEMAERGLLTIVDDVEVNPTLIAEWVNEQRMKYSIPIPHLSNEL